MENLNSTLFGGKKGGCYTPEINNEQKTIS
jgi:hypothetical protein